jgi:hypothetical protein
MFRKCKSLYRISTHTEATHDKIKNMWTSVVILQNSWGRGRHAVYTLCTSTTKVLENVFTTLRCFKHGTFHFPDLV